MKRRRSPQISCRSIGHCWCCSRRGIVVIHSRLEVHGSTRYDGRNGVLVNHLRHGIAQQNDVLVEGFDLTLKFDAVDEVNRHRHVFTAQLVEEWILQELAFIGHDMLRVQTLFIGFF
jgi:hypothetical protein